MTLVALIRHGHSTANLRGILSGQLPDVHLSEKGMQQAKELAVRLGEIPVKAILVSPMERCIETISPWVEEFSQDRKVVVTPDLIEVDYGSWSGRKLRSLSKEPLWKIVQSNPSRVAFPQGESIAGMQARALRPIYSSIAFRGKGVVLVVSHGDVIKSIIVSALGLHLDELQRLVIDPGSVSILDFGAAKARLLLLNDSRSVVTDSLSSVPQKRLLVGGGAGITKRGAGK